MRLTLRWPYLYRLSPPELSYFHICFFGSRYCIALTLVAAGHPKCHDRSQGPAYKFFHQNHFPVISCHLWEHRYHTTRSLNHSYTLTTDYWQYTSAVCTGYFLKSTHLMARQNSAAFFSGVLCASPSYLFSVNSCCYNRNFAFPFFVFVMHRLACQGDCFRCYSMSKLPQLLYTFYSRCKPILLPLPSPAFLRQPLAFEWCLLCVIFFSSALTTYPTGR